MELNMEGCRALCEAVLRQAGTDYRKWYKILLDMPDNRAAQSEIMELENFFRSPMFRLLSFGDLNPEATLHRLQQTAALEYGEAKKRLMKSERNRKMSIVNKPAVQCDMCGAVRFAEWGGSSMGWVLPSGWQKSPYNESFHVCEKHRDITALWEKGTNKK